MADKSRRFALVDNATGKVLNVSLRVSETDPWPAADGQTFVPADDAGGPGDTWDGREFIPAPQQAAVETSEDRLLGKLVQKGTLTAQEVAEIKQ
jgi:hypothetical protein